jgi:hypothetical protein
VAASPDPGADDADVERLLIRAVAALVLFVFAVGVALVLVRGQGDGGGSADDDTVSSSSAPLDSAGPLVGADLSAYVAQRRQVLATLTGSATAVVSFASYRTADATRQLLGGLEIRALLAAVPGGTPAVVTGDVPSWVAKQRADATAERDNLQQMLRDTKDPDFAAQFRVDVARLTELLAHLDPNGAVVFGAVVEGRAAALRALTARSRLVDVVGRTPPAPLSGLHGLRPEEAVKAGDPPTRPVSSAG